MAYDYLTYRSKTPGGGVAVASLVDLKKASPDARGGGQGGKDTKKKPLHFSSGSNPVAELLGEAHNLKP